MPDAWWWLPSVALAGFLLDAAIGDPPCRWHPIRVLGSGAKRLEVLLFAKGLGNRVGGFVHLLLIVALFVGAWALPRWAMATWTHPALCWVWDAAWCYALLCLRDLVDHGRAVHRALAADDLPAARAAVGRLVGRDVDQLDAAGVRRAAIESVSENLTDGVLTPFWALCLFGLPGLLVVKAVSTLDSMIGHRTPRYLRFGWAAARLDDLIHWLPARASPWIVAIACSRLGLDHREAINAAYKWHTLLPSPNSGWAEAAYAGALKTRLVGPIHAGGELVADVWLGEPDWPEDPGDDGLDRALRLTWMSGLVAAIIGLLLAVGMNLSSS